VTRNKWLNPDLEAYVLAHSAQPDPLLSLLAAETAESFPAAASMQIGSDQGTFLTTLTRAIGAGRAVEVGTFTGYSSICIARGLADGGKLTCCDISEEWASVARRYWQMANVDDRIELYLRPALETLRELPANELLDIAFIDANKDGYVNYWNEIVPRMRTDGVILVDNTLYDGLVLDPDSDHPDVPGVKAFNDYAVTDDRVEVVLLSIGDGLTMARKR
jgi:caffeoyl-CoA O-methyltransferase